MDCYFCGMKNVLLFCLSLFFIVPASSQVARILFIEKISLDGNDMFPSNNANVASDGEISVCLPKSGPHQILLERKFSIEPFNEEDKGDHVNVRWFLSKVLPVREIVIETSMLVSNTIGHKSSLFGIDDKELDQYLKEENRFPYGAKEIQNFADQLESNDADSLMDEMMMLVIQSLSFEDNAKHHGGLVKAIKRGKVDYLHLAELVTSLYRAKGIPARVVNGYRVSFEMERDCWVEVFVEDKGWVRKYLFVNPIDESSKSQELFGIAVSYDENQIRKIKIRKGLSYKVDNQLLYSTEPMQREALENYKNHELIKSDSLFRILINEIPQYYNYYNFLGITRARQGQFDNALGLLQQAMNLSKSDEEKCYTYYAFANFAALKNETKLAVKYLDLVLKKGCVSLEKIKKDPDLSTIAQTEEFLTLIEKYEDID